jgi:hypothetical protein
MRFVRTIRMTLLGRGLLLVRRVAVVFMHVCHGTRPFE